MENTRLNIGFFTEQFLYFSLFCMLIFVVNLQEEGKVGTLSQMFLVMEFFLGETYHNI